MLETRIDLTLRSHMAEKKAPCHVWKGNNRLRGLHTRGNRSVNRSVTLHQLVCTNLMFHKRIQLTLFRLHLRPENAQFVLVKSVEENSGFLVLAVFSSRYLQRVSE